MPADRAEHPSVEPARVEVDLGGLDVGDGLPARTSAATDPLAGMKSTVPVLPPMIVPSALR